MKQSEPNYKARPDSVLEISRRIKSGQRELFDFLNLFKKMNLKPDMITLASPPNVRVNLISRYDNIKPQGSEHIAGLAQRQISELLGLRQIATCDEYATITLGTAMLSDKGDGWTAVEMPIVSSDYSFNKERTALTDKINRVTDEVGALWYPVEPALQVMEFRSQAETAGAILEFVQARAPRQTEVFEASLRFRTAA